MESAREGERLLAQESSNSSRSRLLLAGLTPGQRVLDAGCGAGAVTASLLELTGNSGHVTAFDPSEARLALARKTLGGAPNLELRQVSLPNTSLPAASFDFVWSQFVLEYLAQPSVAVAELVRLTRPGGTVAVAEIDGYGLGLWPISERLSAGLESFQRALKAASFDLFVGRKLFTLFRAQGLREVSVRLSPFHVTAGAADEAMLEDWRVRFSTLEPLGVQSFGSLAAWNAFTGEYLETLRDPEALKYAVVLTTVGLRP